MANCFNRSAATSSGVSQPPAVARVFIEAITGRDWLFDDGNYHIDVSHLAAVVRFARFLPPESAGLPVVLELCEYGKRLSPQFQFPADPPFDDVLHGPPAIFPDSGERASRRGHRLFSGADPRPRPILRIAV